MVTYMVVFLLCLIDHLFTIRNRWMRVIYKIERGMGRERGMGQQRGREREEREREREKREREEREREEREREEREKRERREKWVGVPFVVYGPVKLYSVEEVTFLDCSAFKQLPYADRVSYGNWLLHIYCT